MIHLVKLMFLIFIILNVFVQLWPLCLMYYGSHSTFICCRVLLCVFIVLSKVKTIFLPDITDTTLYGK